MWGIYSSWKLRPAFFFFHDSCHSTQEPGCGRARLEDLAQGRNGDAPSPRWTQVWEEPLRQRLTTHQSHPLLGLCFAVTRDKISLSTSQQGKQRLKYIFSFWSLGIWQGQGGHGTGRPTSRGRWGLLFGDPGGWEKTPLWVGAPS